MSRLLALVSCSLVILSFLGSGSVRAAPSSESEVEQVEQVEHASIEVPPASEQAMQYYRSGNVLWVAEQLWSLLIPAVLLWFGWSAKLRSWVARVVRDRWYFTVAGYWIVYLAITSLLSLPLSYYAQYVRPHAYGLSDQALSKWATDTTIGFVLAAIVGALLVWIPFAIIKKSPNRWWIWTSLVAIPLAFGALIIVPVFIQPLFNDFGPLTDKALEAKILAMAERAGIEGGRVFEVNKSVDTNTVNAYVTGLGSTKRIVLWDTLLQQLDERQILLVMGHEMGHYVLGHMYWSLGIMVVTIPAMLAATHYGARWFIGRYRDRIGFDSLADVAALPLIIVISNLLGLATAPLFNYVSRSNEHESDRFALEMTHDNDACASAFLKLQQQNLGNPWPGPLFKLWRASHPTLGERIEFCNEYRPWETGEPQQYSELFE